MNRSIFNYLLYLFVLIFPLSSIMGQTTEVKLNKVNQILESKGEVYFKFRIADKKMIHELTKIISIDNVVNEDVYAYANAKEWNAFKQYKIEFTILANPGDIDNPKMQSDINIKEINAWDFYPTYDAYESMMYQFASNYPNICTIVNIGTLASGRKLLAAKISNNVNLREAEPQFLYTSSMHGDELTGYVLMLRLIDYLLANYGTNSKVTNMIDNMEIWINPLANPDGTYRTGNASVSGATRTNANSVDLNRNFPDPADGPHPDGNAYQQETQYFIQLANQQNFNLSANFHGGAEVVNYPWDTWARLPVEEDWWIFQSRKFADTVHANCIAGYLDDLYNGITNGYAWYELNGGRQDFMNYYHNCREFTIEISNTKLPAAAQLPSFWNYNYLSLLNYVQQALYGVKGIVVDSLTNQPINAMIFVNNYDAAIDSSMVFSNDVNGYFHKYLLSGNYSMTISKYGYFPKTIQGINVNNGLCTNLDTIKLSPGLLIADFSASSNSFYAGGIVNFTDQSYGNPTTWNWNFQGGSPSTATTQNPSGIQFNTPGIFNVSLSITSSNGSNTIVKNSYIHVIDPINVNMSNQYIASCNSSFYDSGGSASGYSAGENYTLIFNPVVAGDKIKASFTSFSTEADWDFLYIYDGNSTAANQISGSPFHGTNSPGTIVATNTSGSLTFRFTSDSNTQSTGWVASVSCVGAPVADFISENDSVLKNGSLQFTDNSTNNPSTWQWSFAGGLPATSTQQNPVVTYSNVGVYSVSLTTTNSYGSSSVTKNNFITVYNQVGLDNYENTTTISIYPNPASKFIKVICPNDCSVLFMDMLGNILYQNENFKSNSKIDLTSFPSGVYFVKVSTNKEFIYKIIKIEK